MKWATISGPTVSNATGTRCPRFYGTHTSKAWQNGCSTRRTCSHRKHSSPTRSDVTHPTYPAHTTHLTYLTYLTYSTSTNTRPFSTKVL